MLGSLRRGGFYHAGMTQDLFRTDAYRTECPATITALTDQGIVLNQTVFYPLGGGQAGDAGALLLTDGRSVKIADTRKAKDAEGQPTTHIVHSPALGQETLIVRLRVGDALTAQTDWARRHRLMRFHTTTHLLRHLVPGPVNGCAITPDYARLALHMTDPLDKEALTAGIAALMAAAHPVTLGSVTDAELDANPALVKSMGVSPPRGSGLVRTVQVGVAAPVDLAALRRYACGQHG